MRFISFVYFCNGIGEKSGSDDALLLFRTKPKTREKLFWNSYDLKAEEAQRMAFPCQTVSAMHTLMAWCDLICLAGVPISHARSSGLVHRDGHAILCALTFALRYLTT